MKFLFFLAFLYSNFSFAQVLPQGIWSPSIRTGQISGLGQIYDDQGTLRNLGSTKSITFDAQTLSGLTSGSQLIQTLNAFGYNLGNQVNLGTFEVDTKPNVQYLAPVLGYGINSRWTVGVGVPIITYTNNISLKVSNSNASIYSNQLGGRVDQNLDQALQTNIINSVQSLLIENGYEPLANRNSSFLADIQVSSIYELLRGKNSQFFYKLNLGLPTGPKDNPNDLLALNQFGRTSIENVIQWNYRLASKWTYGLATGYLYYLRDTVQKRSNGNEAGALLPPSRSFNRQLGSSVHLTQELDFAFNDRWSLTPGIMFQQKHLDHFSNESMSFFEKNSDTSYWRSLLSVKYSTIQAYHKKEFLFPSLLQVQLAENFQGRNIEKQTKMEVQYYVFF